MKGKMTEEKWEIGVSGAASSQKVNLRSCPYAKYMHMTRGIPVCNHETRASTKMGKDVQKKVDRG